jgi:hypothetical protein
VRVRHKLKMLTNILTVLEESASYYIVVGPQGEGTMAVEKASWEPIPTETWRDVTGECRYLGASEERHGDCIAHSEANSIASVCRVYNGYRLRKVQLMTGTDFSASRQWAFIIEKRES